MQNPKDIIAANMRLKSLKARCSIIQRGDRLCLRGTFPAKPTATRQDWHRQLIFLGVNATPAGIKFAENEAIKLSMALDQGLFDWSVYLKKDEESLSIEDWVQKFKEHKLAQGIELQTWKTGYAVVLKQLKNFDVDLAKKLVFSTEANSRNRQRFCIAIEAFFKFCDREISLDEYKGSYKPSKNRYIPTDAEIEEWFFKIDNPEYQWAYGILATYGIRPSEINKLQFEKMPILICHGKKSDRSDRIIYPYPDKWVELFDLANPKFKDKKTAAKQINVYFLRHGLPFTPYALRDRWAIRTMELGLDIKLRADEMGHSVQVHSEEYLRWIKDEQHAIAFEKIKAAQERSPKQ